MVTRKQKILILIIIVIISILLTFKNSTKMVEENDKIIEKPNYIMYGFGVFFFIMLVILAKEYFLGDEPVRLVDQDEATNYYFWWLERHRKITVPKSVKEIFNDPVGDWYRMVFQWRDPHSKLPKYAPIEIYKYYVINKHGKDIIHLGHGRGVITEKFEKVKTFMLRNKINTQSEITSQMIKSAVCDYLRERDNNG